MMMDHARGANVPGTALANLIRFNAVLSYVFVWTAAGMTLAFFVGTLIEIISRSLFHYSFVWIGEMATFCFIWALFLSAAVCFRSNSHLFVDVINATTGGKTDRFLRFVGFLAVLIMAVAFVYFGWSLIQRGFERTTPNLGVPMFYGWLAPFVMGVAMIPFCIEEYFAPGQVTEDLLPPGAV